MAESDYFDLAPPSWKSLAQAPELLHNIDATEQRELVMTVEEDIVFDGEK